MKKRWGIRVAILLAVSMLAVLITPTSRLILFGWVRGEACYRSKPTSGLSMFY